MTMKRRCHANEQYSRRECLEILGILASIAESKMLEIWRESNVPIEHTSAEDCHDFPSKGSPNKIIIKLNYRKGIRRILLNKNKLKSLKPESVNLPGETKFSLMKVCACIGRIWGPNVKGCGVLVTFPRFGQEWIAENQAVQWICVHDHTWLWFGKAISRQLVIDWF